MHLKDKVILITGGTSGIGEACTELFCRHGAKVVTMSIQQPEGAALAKRLCDEGGTCLFHYGDTSKEADVKAAVEEAVARYGRLDFAFNNAGIGPDGKRVPTAYIVDCPEEIWDRTVELAGSVEGDAAKGKRIAAERDRIDFNLLGGSKVAHIAIPVDTRTGCAFCHHENGQERCE